LNCDEEEMKRIEGLEEFLEFPSRRTGLLNCDLVLVEVFDLTSK